MKGGKIGASCLQLVCYTTLMLLSQMGVATDAQARGGYIPPRHGQGIEAESSRQPLPLWMPKEKRPQPYSSTRDAPEKHKKPACSEPTLRHAIKEQETQLETLQKNQKDFKAEGRPLSSGDVKKMTAMHEKIIAKLQEKCVKVDEQIENISKMPIAQQALFRQRVHFELTEFLDNLPKTPTH